VAFVVSKTVNRTRKDFAMEKTTLRGPEISEAILAGRIQVAVGSNRVKEILPHGLTKLYLDEVLVTRERVAGWFLVTELACLDHEVFGDGKKRAIFRGSDYLDAFAQLLGVSASLVERVPRKLGCVVRGYGECRFFGLASPEDRLILEVELGKIEVELLTLRGEPTAIITARDLVARVAGQVRAKLAFVQLVAR